MKEETILRKQVLKYLQHVREETGKCVWIYVPQDYVTAGIPDIVGCAKGKFFAIELKTPKKNRGKLTLMQVLTLDDIGVAGGYRTVAKTLLEVKKFMERILHD